MKNQILIIVVLIFISCSSNNHKVIKYYQPPHIQGVTVTDSFFDKVVEDLYRNLEKTKDTTIANWYKAQTQYTTGFLNAISKRDSLINFMYKIDNRESFYIKKLNITKSNQHFYLKKNIEEKENRYKLYTKKNKDHQETLLYDPINYKPELNLKHKINYIKPSWDGKYIVVSLSHSGKEMSDMIILDVVTQKPLPNILLTNAWPSSFLGVNWLPDNSGFTYLHFQEDNVKDSKFKENAQSVLYIIGKDSNQLNFIFGNKTHPQFAIGDKEYPTTKIKSATDKYIVGYISGVNNYWNAYYTTIKDIKRGLLNWKPLYTSQDKVKTSSGIFVNDDYIYITSKESSNFKLASTTINDLNFNHPKIIFEGKPNEVINTFRVNKDAIYVTTTKYGIEANLYKIVGNKIEKLKLPKKSGRLSLSSKSINYNDIWVNLRGWTTANERYKYNLKTNSFTEANLSSKVNYPEFKDLIVEEVMVTSHDGEEIPLSIIYKKGTPKNSTTPTIIESYGAFGDIFYPYFSPVILSWVAEGGIYCTAHVRGGGEKGDAWHKAGYKTTKPNTWKDVIACSEYMIDNKFTSKNNLALYGSSAGGIDVGRAMTERPDLFAAVISEVGLLNPLRHDSDGGGGSNYKEFGTVKDSIECIALIEMDPYLHIKDSIDYPATFLTVGMNDPRVMPWMSGKFAARLQNANILKKPILLYADFNAGHNGNESYEMKIYEEWGNVFAFAFWQTGHPDYQLKD